MREGGNVGRAQLLLDLGEHALDLGMNQDALGRALPLNGLLAVRVARATGMREEVEARVLDHDCALEQLGQRATDLVDALAVEHQLPEAAVDVNGALQSPILPVAPSLHQR